MSAPKYTILYHDPQTFDDLLADSEPVEILKDGSVRPIRPVKTPLFVPPPPPDGYRLERAPLENFAQVNWVPVSSFYDESRHRRVKVKWYYTSRVVAEKVAIRIRETSWHKEVRVTEYWIRPSDRPLGP